MPPDENKITEEDRLLVAKEALTLLYDGQEPALDTRHLLTDQHQTLVLLHECSGLLHALSSSPFAPFLGDPTLVATARAIALVAHFVSCERTASESEESQWPQHPFQD